MAASKPTLTSERAPVARTVDARDTYFGETLADPYRWMENAQDPQWMPWLRAQDAFTRRKLSASPARAGLLKRIQQLSADTVATSEVQRAGGKLFFEQRPKGADNYQLFVRESGRDRLLVDPTALGGKSGHFSLDWWHASPDGRHVAYGLSEDGSEDSTLHVLLVADGRDLPERIPNTGFATPQWLDDGSGFFYNQLTGALDSPERYLDSQARFHRLGTPVADDPVLVKRGHVPGLEFEAIQVPVVLTYPGATHVVLSLADVRSECRWLIAPLEAALAGGATWQPIADFPDEVTGLDLHEGELTLLANHDHPRGRLMRTTVEAPSIAAAREVVPQGADVLEDFSRARDGLYLRYLDGGVSRLRRLTAQGAVVDIALPFEGSVGDVFATQEEDGVLIALSGWLSPSSIWSVDAKGQLADTGLTPRPRIDVSGYVSERFFAIARDGTHVPYNIVHRKGLRADGAAPCYVQAYGSYGVTGYPPGFVGRMLALVDAGFIVGFAHVRGGGEYGREWHRAGQLENKPNTWRDLIAVCEDLCSRQLTSPARLAIGGRSAGGITVGRAMTERPDLFAAVVSGVGWSNPLRYVVEQNGVGEVPEWGDIDSPAGYRALRSIDSYQAVVDGTRYPAVLITTGVTDPRVAPFHAGKLAARLQAATSSDRPVLLRVDFDAGHGMGSTRAQQDREAADTFAFLIEATIGAPDGHDATRPASH
ncbi:MAG: prolyl oligopeptidase family serine peptidase [Steroidobacteraceae bacterium]